MSSATMEFDVPVTMRDGVVLRADVYRPAGEGPWPVLLMRTPYDKQMPLMFTGILDTIRAVQRGYIVVHQDTRGRFKSDGEWLPWASERNDGYDTVEWAATIHGSNGRVGMFGASYTGNTQWAAAVTRPPHLVVIAPQVTWSEPADGIFYRGGALEYGLNVSWSLAQSMAQYPKTATSMQDLIAKLGTTMYDVDHLADQTCWELPSGASPALARTGQPDIGTQRGLGDPASIDEARVAGRHADVTVPSLNVAGWFDVFQQGSVDNYIESRKQGLTSRLIVGPWEHSSSFCTTPGYLGDINYGLDSLPPGSDRTLSGIQLDWFDQFLADKPANAAHESGVDYFVMGINEWRHEDQWPLPRARATDFYLHSDGTLSTSLPTATESTSTYTYDPADPTPTTGGAVFICGAYPPGAHDQKEVESRDDVLVYTSEPLTDDLEITGRVAASIFASTDGPSTDWVVRLCEVDEHGRSLNIVDGITRVTTESGRVDEHDIDLWSTSIVIRAGHRLRVQVTSSNFPRWDRNLNTGEDPTIATTIRVAQQTIHHDNTRPSRITLPIIPA
ncbi:CocE/NonD family hydrolase [Rhodococcus erythropolis]|uniref:CocE/NonD family hydrolase n=1 Tax=Rhodococcus erythropolis TaxID=1833 RepID=UPI00294A4924|nr:CocE/NonD family hydrolase [Rhodococcus erythropolis]MDV6212741.1 CocE/NonD family hydrolase [Rhodococcus erythropolis]